MQNLVVLMEQSGDASWRISSKAGSMSLNRFCIDEDAAFELSSVHNLERSYYEIEYHDDFENERKFKGRGMKSLLSTILRL